MVTPILTLLFALTSFSALGAGGYDFLFGKSSTTIHFEMFRNLIVIPVTINDSVKVKLILDTGTRSMLLYGKRFASMPNLTTSHRIKIAGWGSPDGVDAGISYPNKVVLGSIKGELLGVAVVSTRKMFDEKPGIDGIIGYELFVKFVVEINYKARTICLFEKLPYGHADGFISLPLEINRAMPQVQSSLVMADNSRVNLRLLIDTGSSLGLTVFSKEQFLNHSGETPHNVGFGLNGVIKGFDLYLKHFFLGNLKVKSLSSCVVNVEEHPDETFTFCGSLGAQFLKKHIVIFDYPSNKLFLLSYKASKALTSSSRIVALPS
jgi:hypothetical protein